MNSHRLFNYALALAIAVLVAVVGPTLDADPYESPAQAARAALAAGDAEGHEHLLRVCRAKHGEMADVRWTPEGPSCSRFPTGRHLLADAK